MSRGRGWGVFESVVNLKVIEFKKRFCDMKFVIKFKAIFAKQKYVKSAKKLLNNLFYYI
jgi:hypothetical protein